MENGKMKKAAVLKYPENFPAPILVAKGSGKMAERIMELAKENSVPIIENLEETEIITMQDVGECIPEETYEAIAKIFAFIKYMKK